MDSFYFFATEKESLEGWLEGEGGGGIKKQTQIFLGKKSFLTSLSFLAMWCGKNTVGQKVKSK